MSGSSTNDNKEGTFPTESKLGKEITLLETTGMGTPL